MSCHARFTLHDTTPITTNDIRIGEQTYTFGELHKGPGENGGLNIAYQFCGKGLPETRMFSVQYGAGR